MSSIKEITIKLDFLIPSLPKAEKRTALYIKDNLHGIEDMTVATLAEEADSSEATIIRLCKKLGYTSYVQFKQSLVLGSKNRGKNPESSTKREHKKEKDASLKGVFDRVTDEFIATLERTRAFFSEDYDRALDAILNARAVYMFATGDAQSSCQLASYKFNRIGIPTSVCTDVIFQYETALRLTKKDVLIAISASGKSINVVNAAKMAHDNGALTISITQTPKSPLAKHSDINLFTSPVDNTMGRDSVSKRVAELAIIEVFYLGAISRGALDYEKMLRNTMESSDMNKF